MNIAMVKNSSQNNTLKNRRITNIILGFLLAVFVFVPFVQNDLKAEGEVTLYVDINVETEATSRTDDNATFKTISNALSFANNGDTIKLISNVKENITVASDKNIILDLNGYVLSGKNQYESIVIYNLGNLTITDTYNENAPLHYFVVSNIGLWQYQENCAEPYDYIFVNGNLFASSDTNYSTKLSCIPEENDVVAIKGGCITDGKIGIKNGERNTTYNYEFNNPTKYNLGVLNLLGGNIVGNNNYGSNGGGIFSYYGLSIGDNSNVSKCRIVGNVSLAGGGIYCDQNLGCSYCNINGGVFRYNVNYQQGGGIYCGAYDAKISNCDISYNITNGNSYGIAAGLLIFNNFNHTNSMINCNVIGNICNNQGGGVYIRNDSSFIIKNCTISNNNSNLGSGVYFGDIRGNVNNGLLTLCGDVIIDKVEQTDIANDLFLNNSSFIKFYLDDSNVLSNNSRINISYSNNDNHKGFCVSSNITVNDDYLLNDISSIIKSDQNHYLFNYDNSIYSLNDVNGSSGDCIAIVFDDANLNKFVGYTTLQEAVNNASETKRVVLIKDVKECININNDDNLVLDLNGRVLKGNDGIVVNNNGTLTIIDSNPTSKHYFEVDSNGKWCLIDKPTEYSELSSIDSIVSTGTKVEVEGGCITGGYVDYFNGAGICNEASAGTNKGAVLTINAGNIIGNHCSYEYGGGIFNDKISTLNLNGGKVVGNYSYVGGGIRNEGILNISGSSVIGFNKSFNAGGGISNIGGKTIVENDVNKEINTAVINMTGGKVIYNTTKQCGGAGIHTEGRLLISGDSLIGYNSTFGEGSGIENSSNDYEGSGYLQIDGGTVSYNVGGSGAGIKSNGTLIIAGNISSKVNIVNNDAKYGDCCGGGIFNEGSFIINGLSDSSTTYTVNICNNNALKGGGIYSKGDVDIIGYVSISNNNADNQTGGGDGGGIYLIDCDITLDNGLVSNNAGGNYGAGICSIGEGSSVILKNNAEISNNVGRYCLGGGIFIEGLLEMNDSSTISDNVTKFSGGGVFVSDKTNARVVLNDSSSITNNSTEAKGGGIYSKGSITLNDNAAITDNTSDSDGGGIFLQAGTLTINNSSLIDSNEAVNGGGIYNESTVIFNDLTKITNNTSSSLGGGIYNKNTLTINDTTEISNNSAGLYGGGIINRKDYYNNFDPSLVMNGGKIIENEAETGAGVYNDMYSSFIMHGLSDVSYNIAKNSAGGVYNHGEFEMNTTQSGIPNISYNEAGSAQASGGNGGGVYSHDDFIMNGGSIHHNIAHGQQGFGGGVFVSGSLELKGTTSITDNKGIKGGGVYYYTYSEDMKVDGFCTIKNNTCADKANNLYFASGDTIDVGDNLTDTSYIGISHEDVTDYNNKKIILSTKKYFDKNIFVVDDIRYYFSLVDDKDIYINGRIKNEPTVNNGYKYEISDTDYLGTVSYQWYRIADNNDNLLINNNDSSLDTSNIVFGSYKCIASGSTDTIEDFSFTSKIINIVPNIINHPSNTNEYLMDVDKSKCSDNNIVINYEWYKVEENPNQLSYISPNTEDVTILTSAELSTLVGKQLTVSAAYDSTKNRWSIADNSYLAFNLSLSSEDIISISSFDVDEADFTIVVYKNNTLYGDIEYGFCGSFGASGVYTFILYYDNDSNAVAGETVIGLVDSYSEMDSSKIILPDEDVLSELDVDSTPVTYDSNNNVYNVAKQGGLFKIEMDENELLLVLPEDGYNVYGIVLDNEFNIINANIGPSFGFMPNVSGDYYLFVYVMDDEYDAYASSVSIAQVGGRKYTKVDGYSSDKLSGLEQDTYAAHAIYKDNNYLNETCTLISNPFYFSTAKQLVAIGTTVNDKIYDGTLEATANLSLVKGIDLEDLGKVGVEISSALFEDKNAGSDIGITVKYKLVGDEDVISKYIAPEDNSSFTAHIMRKDVQVKAIDKTINFGDAVPQFEANVTGLIGSDSVLYTFNSVDPTSKGFYRIVPSGSAIQGNYNVTYVSSSLNVLGLNEDDGIKTDPVIIAKLLEIFAVNPEYQNKSLSIELSMDDSAPLDTDVAKVRNEVGANTLIESHEAKVLLKATDASGTQTIDLGDNAQMELLPIGYDFDFVRRYDIHVWRVHNGVLDELTINPNSLGERVIYDYNENMIYVWARKYSTYSITYKELQDSVDFSTYSYVPVKTCID